ncbi:MAG: hypothetical protein MUE60_09925 [Candidatus Eisenbacteria bacterium]|jgi:competence protein ComGC|nr:hypothetical protein [Candidatus Eisenbacteria bacterium]
MRLKRTGISLIDVMIVLATLAVIAVLLIPQYNEKKARAQKAVMVAQSRNDMVELKLAEELFFERTGRFTDNLADLVSLNPALRGLACPFDGSPYEILSDTTRLQIKCSVSDPGVIDGGVPSWLAEPGSEGLRASLIVRSRDRMGKVSAALDAYKAATGSYTASLDSLEAVSSGVRNLLCPLMMKRFSIILSDSLGFEVTSHLDEVGRIVGGRPDFPPLPTPKT